MAGAPFYVAPAALNEMDGDELRFWAELADERLKEDSRHGARP